MLALEDSPTGRFLDGLAQRMPRPRAVLVASAHFNRAQPTVTAGNEPQTIHDFGGFPAALHAIRYPAPGAPALAADVARRLATAGFDARVDAAHGFDHGVWVPLKRMFPDADVPVVAMSVNPQQSARWHYRLGEALAPLRHDGVLVMGSGGFSHNLRALDWQGAGSTFPWVQVFVDALRARLLAGDVDGALDWPSLPEALRNHPTPEHLLPLFVALGAGGEHARARALHADTEMGGLALDAFAFDAAA